MIAAIANQLTTAGGGNPFLGWPDQRDQPAVTNVRHSVLLERARAALLRATEALAGEVSEEFPLLDLQEAGLTVASIHFHIGRREHVRRLLVFLGKERSRGDGGECEESEDRSTFQSFSEDMSDRLPTIRYDRYDSRDRDKYDFYFFVIANRTSHGL